MDEMYIEKRAAIPAIGFYPHEPISTGVSFINSIQLFMQHFFFEFT